MATKKFSGLIADETTTLTATAVGDYILIYDASEPLDIKKVKVISIADILKLTTETARQPLVTSQAAGDIFYASAAGVLARLAKGAANQALKMNALGTVPEWGSSGGINAIAQKTFSASQTFTSDTWTDITNATLSLVTNATCKIVVLAIVTGYNDGVGNAFIVRSMIAGTADPADYNTQPFNGSAVRNEALPYIYFASAVPAGTITVKLQCRKQGTNNVVERGTFIAIAFTE